MSSLSHLIDCMEECCGLSRDGNCCIQYGMQYFDDSRRAKLAAAPKLLRRMQTLYPMFAMPMAQLCCFYQDLCSFNVLLDSYMQTHMRKSTLHTFNHVLIMQSLIQLLCFVQREVMVYVLESACSVPMKNRITSATQVQKTICMLADIKNEKNPFDMVYQLFFVLSYDQDTMILKMRRQIFLFNLKLAIWKKIQ